MVKSKIVCCRSRSLATEWRNSINPLIATSLKFVDQKLWILDQHRLPQQEIWIECTDANQMVQLIQNLQIRGAPLIAIGASLLVGHLAERLTGTEAEKATQLRQTIAQLRAARPTAVNLMHAMDRLAYALEHQGSQILPTAAEDIFNEDIQLCAHMARHGAALLPYNAQVITHCNTGSLATTGVGTALGVISYAHQQGKNVHVYVSETRPLLQGARLTCWELAQAQIPHTLMCDSMAAALMSTKKIDAVLVGADRIAANGDTANKIGTYALALVAKQHDVPFYIVAPSTTVDSLCASGQQIPIEQRNAQEVRGVSGSFGHAQWVSPHTQVFNPAFDVTPAQLIGAWILESGIYTQADIKGGAFKQSHSLN